MQCIICEQQINPDDSYETIEDEGGNGHEEVLFRYHTECREYVSCPFCGQDLLLLEGKVAERCPQCGRPALPEKLAQAASRLEDEELHNEVAYFLDDVVQEIALNIATDQNNQGLEAQLRFLVEMAGESFAEEQLKVCWDRMCEEKGIDPALSSFMEGLNS